MIITPRTAWILGRLMAGMDVNGELGELIGPFKGIGDHLAGLAVADRQAALEGFLASRDDRDAIILAIANGDPSGPMPEAEHGDDAPEGDDWGPIRFGMLPNVEPFPLDVLPLPARELSEAAAESIACPIDFPAVACLAVASGIIGRSASLMIKPGYFASASMNAALLGGPSSGKSPALRAISAVLWAIAAELYDEWKAAHDAWQETPKEERGPAPILRRLVSTDCTTEALGPILAENPRGLMISPDEMTKWVMSMDQYKGGKGGDRPFYLSAWAGEPVYVDRAKNMKAPIAVPHPFLTVVGGMTPDMLSSLPEGKGRDDGFLARLLFTFPDCLPKRYSERGIPEEIASEWATLIRSLWNRSMRDEDGNRPTPHVVRMTPEARKAWVALMNAHHAEQEAHDFDDDLEGAWGKLEAYAGRLALIVHLMELASDPIHPAPEAPPELPRPIIDRVDALLVYFKSHARRTYAAMGGKAEQGGSDVRAIIRWILRNDRDRFSTRDIGRNFDRFRDDDAALADALDWLARHNIIRAARPEGEANRAHRKSAPAFDVNPALKTSPRFRHFRRNAAP